MRTVLEFFDTLVVSLKMAGQVARVLLQSSGSACYSIGGFEIFAQGIPHGLLAIALPAWLAAEGASASAVGSYLAIIMLPWAFKLVTGPLMDRFEYLPMGRRRPWVIGAQLGLSLALLAGPAEAGRHVRPSEARASHVEVYTVTTWTGRPFGARSSIRTLRISRVRPVANSPM